jgi:hypothetical protein
MKSESFTAKLTPQRKPFTDIVGLELGAGLAQGVPAVRLRKRDNKTELVAAGFLTLPGSLPESADTGASEAVIWHLPGPFQAAHAALAVNSKHAFIRHSASAGDDLPEKKQIAYRQTSRVIAPDLPPLLAGLPEFQAAWAARLLPEGHRPTACSLQIAAAAAMSGLIAAPTFAAASGNAIALFVFAEYTALAAFQETKLVLYREHPVGARHLRDAIGAQMGIDVSLADSVLDDTLIDPTPIIEPVLRPLFRQVEISSDYLLRRRNCPVKHFFVCGLNAGARYWSAIFTRMMSQPLTPCQPFDGIEPAVTGTHVPKDLSTVAPLLMAAAGAARAVLEDV